MKENLKQNIGALIAMVFLISCGGSGKKDSGHGHDHGSGGHEEEIRLSMEQFQSMEMEIDTLSRRNMSSYVVSNGQLEVPPQNEAEVTAIIGSNVQSIQVIEGETVKKGQVLAYLAHPDLIQIQTDYLTEWNELQFLELEYKRQEKLYAEKVSSGKEYQKTKSDYFSKQGVVKGLEAQLGLLGISPEKVQKNELYQKIAVRSPIDGYIRLVEIKVGQFVRPEMAMFEIVNTEHIHADLMVFEKDVHKVKEGQKVLFTVESLPGKELEAVIYSVGKAFEQDPKAIHLHAEIENKEGLLIPGMYVNGKILTENSSSMVIPEEGIVKQNDKYFIFQGELEGDGEDQEWSFKPIEVVAGVSDGGWVEVSFLSPIEEDARFAMNNAYILMADLKKEEAEHSH